MPQGKDKPIVTQNVTAGVNDPVYYGTTQMDQSIRIDNEPEPRVPNQGNVMPNPEMRRGTC